MIFLRGRGFDLIKLPYLPCIRIDGPEDSRPRSVATERDDHIFRRTARSLIQEVSRHDQKRNCYCKVKYGQFLALKGK